MNRNYNIGVKMTRKQVFWGWLYLPFYLVLTSWWLQFLAGLLGLEITDFQLNLAYFAVNFAVVLLIYHRFLIKSFRGFTEHFWKFIQTLILGFALYYFTNYVLSWLLETLGGSRPNFNDEVVNGLVLQNRAAMLVCSVVVAPVVEEVLVRGVVFGTIHGKSRIAAYIVSVLLFCFMHVWQYYGSADFIHILRSALQYIPAAAALGWTYEKSGTIWTPIVLHAIINAISYGLAVGV